MNLPLTQQTQQRRRQPAGQVRGRVDNQQVNAVAANLIATELGETDPRAIEVRDAPPDLAAAVGVGGYFLIDPDGTEFQTLPTELPHGYALEVMFDRAQSEALPVFRYTPGRGPRFADALAEREPQYLDTLVSWMGYIELTPATPGGQVGGVPGGANPQGEGGRVMQILYLSVAVLPMADGAVSAAVTRFTRYAARFLRSHARQTGREVFSRVAEELERRYLRCLPDVSSFPARNIPQNLSNEEGWQYLLAMWRNFRPSLERLHNMRRNPSRTLIEDYLHDVFQHTRIPHQVVDPGLIQRVNPRSGTGLVRPAEWFEWARGGGIGPEPRGGGNLVFYFDESLLNNPRKLYEEVVHTVTHEIALARSMSRTVKNVGESENLPFNIQQLLQMMVEGGPGAVERAWFIRAID